MPRLLLFAFGLACLAASAPHARAQSPSQLFIASYVEVAASSAGAGETALKAYRDAVRRNPAATLAQVFQQLGRGGHFVVLEEWRDEAAHTAHMASPGAKQLADALKPIRISLYDQRKHTALAVRAGASGAAGVFVVTHVDMIPANVERARRILADLAGTSRSEAGNVRFDVLQGVRPNHFTVVESWRDERAREAHVTAAHTKAARDELQQMAPDGSPYDERLYRLLAP